VALGKSKPASVCTALVKSPSGALGVDETGGDHNQAAIDSIKTLGIRRLAMQGVLQRQHIADRIGCRQRHRRSADDAGVDKGDGEHDAPCPAGIFADPARDGTGVGEIAEFRLAGESRGRDRHHGNGADDDKHDAKPKIGFLIAERQQTLEEIERFFSMMATRPTRAIALAATPGGNYVRAVYMVDIMVVVDVTTFIAAAAAVIMLMALSEIQGDSVATFFVAVTPTVAVFVLAATQIAFVLVAAHALLDVVADFGAGLQGVSERLISEQSKNRNNCDTIHNEIPFRFRSITRF